MLDRKVVIIGAGPAGYLAKQSRKLSKRISQDCPRAEMQRRYRENMQRNLIDNGA